MKSKPGLALMSVVVCLGGIYGCGGGSKSAASAQELTGRASVTIAWPQDSRLIPLASNSIRIDFKKAGQVVDSKLVPRPTNGNIATVTSDPLPTGDLIAFAAAFPQANGSGVAQASGAVPLAISTGKTSTFLISMASTIEDVSAVAAKGTIAVGEATTLSITAKDAVGNTVLVSPSLLNWEALNPSVAVINSSGGILGLTPGQATFKVTETESGRAAQTTVTVIGN
jgi:hypothetical protein